MELEVLTDTVEDNHLIVDRVAYHGEDGSDECLVYLERERHEVVEDRVESDYGYCIYRESRDGAY